MTPEEFDDLLAAYALDAVDDDDRRTVDERLAIDPEARQRLAALEGVVRLAAHELGPPDHVWPASPASPTRDCSSIGAGPEVPSAASSPGSPPRRASPRS